MLKPIAILATKLFLVLNIVKAKNKQHVPGVQKLMYATTEWVLLPSNTFFTLQVFRSIAYTSSPVLMKMIPIPSAEPTR